MQTYAIANCEEVPGRDFYNRIEELVSAGVGWIQLRARQMDDRDLAAVAARLRKLIPTAGARYLVNARADVAVAVSADGVHLPSSGLPADAVRSVGKGLLVGRSCHSLEECRRATSEGANYVVLGPVFSPRSKEGSAGVSLQDLEEAARMGPPVFALGGFSRENISRVGGLPIAGIAGITLFMMDEPVREIVQAVHKL